MSYTHFQPGNLVYVSKADPVALSLVTSINFPYEFYILGENESDEGRHISVVPISADTLLKIGYICVEISRTAIAFRSYPDNDVDIVRVYDDEYGNKKCWLMHGRKVLYIHEIQNIYKEIKGKELIATI